MEAPACASLEGQDVLVVPVGALACLRRLSRLAGSLFLFAGDRADCDGLSRDPPVSLRRLGCDGDIGPALAAYFRASQNRASQSHAKQGQGAGAGLALAGSFAEAFSVSLYSTSPADRCRHARRAFGSTFGSVGPASLSMYLRCIGGASCRVCQSGVLLVLMASPRSRK